MTKEIRFKIRFKISL